MKILQADIEHIDTVTELVNAYREFYKKPSDIAGCRAFIASRFASDDSVIFLAVDEKGEGLGFIQLYPSFSTVGLEQMWILNDLYVTPPARQRGVAEALMRAAHEECKGRGVKRLKLATAIDNTNAQALYKKLGYIKIEAFEHYIKALN